MIVYIVILVVLIIVFFVIGYLKYNDNTPNVDSSNFKDLFLKYQNYGKMVEMDNTDYQLITIGLGANNSNGEFSPVVPRLDPADTLDLIDDRKNEYTCYYPDQIVARRVRAMCTQDLCFPNFHLGDIHEYYTLDPNAVACGNDGSSMGVIVVSDFGDSDEGGGDTGGCLVYNSKSMSVGITGCDPTNENQIWTIDKVDSTGKESMDGIYGSIKPRGIPGYLTPIHQGMTSSNLEISGLTGYNWLFTTVQPYLYGDPGNQTEVTIPKQFVWVGPTFDKSSTIDTIKSEIQKYFSISVSTADASTASGGVKQVNMQPFYLPKEDPPLTNQKTSYVDYTIYNYIKSNPDLL